MGRIEAPVYPELQRNLHAAYVTCGSSRLCPRGGGVHDPLGKAGLSNFAFIRSYQCRYHSTNIGGQLPFLPLKQKLGRLKCHCNDMSTLMAALVKYADSDNTKDPDSKEDNRGMGKRTATPRVSSIIRQAKGTMVSTRPTIVWTLWLTPMLRRTVSAVRANSLRGAEVQALIWSAC